MIVANVFGVFTICGALYRCISVVLQSLKPNGVVLPAWKVIFLLSCTIVLIRAIAIYVYSFVTLFFKDQDTIDEQEKYHDLETQT